jgi:transposase-like protein
MAIEFVSLDTIIHDILYIIRGSNVSQSESINDNQIENWIHQYRALLIKQDLDKGKTINSDYTQEIQCLKLIVVDKSEDSTVKTSRYLLRSELEIPKTIDLNFRSGFTYIGTLDGKEIDFIPQYRVKWQKEKYYTQNSPLAYLKNEHIFIDNDHVIEYLSIRGIFEQPQEVANFVNPYTSISEFTRSSKYPIPINMLSTLKEMILKKELGIMVSSPSDNKNNDNNKVSLNEERS